MDIDPSINSDIQKITWCDHESTQNSGPGKSYRCTFCKRGFSNAQALGGHMNIHRKDRAKLKEFSRDQNLLSLDITKTSVHSEDSRSSGTPDPPPNSSTSDDLSFETSDHTTSDHVLQENSIRRLPLFSEEPSAIIDGSGDQAEGRKFDRLHVEKNKTESSQGGVSGIEVDLELRLGPEPFDAAAKR